MVDLVKRLEKAEQERDALKAQCKELLTALKHIAGFHPGIYKPSKLYAQVEKIALKAIAKHEQARSRESELCQV